MSRHQFCVGDDSAFLPSYEQKIESDLVRLEPKFEFNFIPSSNWTSSKFGSDVIHFRLSQIPLSPVPVLSEPSLQSVQSLASLETRLVNLLGLGATVGGCLGIVCCLGACCDLSTTYSVVIAIQETWSVYCVMYIRN